METITSTQDIGNILAELEAGVDVKAYCSENHIQESTFYQLIAKSVGIDILLNERNAEDTTQQELDRIAQHTPILGMVALR